MRLSVLPFWVIAARSFAADAVNVVQNDDDLLDDLAGRQILQKTELGGKAKVAIQRAAGLR